MPSEPHCTEVYIDYKNAVLHNIRPYNPRVNLDAHLKEQSWTLCNRLLQLQQHLVCDYKTIQI